jgi:uncharacterized protein (TIGR02594 family)
MITRTYTDVTGATLANTLAEIRLDGGTFERIPGSDGTETVIARYDRDPAPIGNSEFPWMPIARGELGIHEGLNSERISEYFGATELGPQPDSVPWCSAFINFCIEQSGQEGTRSAQARSWLAWGEEANEFVPGCVVVLPRGNDPTAGHVGFFAGFDAQGDVRLLGGNQHDSVSVSSFPNAKDNALGKRILANLATAERAVSRQRPAGDARSLLIQAMDDHDVTDNDLRAGIAAIAGGESGMVPHSEIGWGHTDPERTRGFFSALSEMSDEEILALAADDERFFNTVYAGKIGNGDVASGDGFRYRGRGLFQLTGRANYRKYGRMLKSPVDLEGNPEMANDLKIAVEIAVVYMLDRYPGTGGFRAMKAAVGNSIGPPDTNKDQLFADYRANHDFDLA